jgi:hypothetical protein
MVRRRFQRALALAVSCAFAAGVARADEPPRVPRRAPSEILEIADETCLTRENVGERLAALLVATDLPEGLHVALRGDAVVGETTFVVSVPGENVGVRSFDTSGLSCENKLKVVSFAIAVAIEGIVESRAARLRETASPPPSRGAPPPPVRAPRAAPRAPRPRASSAAWSVGLGEGLFTTSLGPTGAVLLSVGRDTSAYGLRASLVQTLGATVDVEPGSVRYMLTLGRIHACASVLRIGAVDGRACALAGFGSFDARGTNFVSAGAGRSPWIDMGAAAEANVRLARRWNLRTSLAPFGVLRAPTLRVTDASSGQVTASSAVPRLGVLLSLELSFRVHE